MSKRLSTRNIWLAVKTAVSFNRNCNKENRLNRRIALDWVKAKFYLGGNERVLQNYLIRRPRLTTALVLVYTVIRKYFTVQSLVLYLFPVSRGSQPVLALDILQKGVTEKDYQLLKRIITEVECQVPADVYRYLIISFC